MKMTQNPTFSKICKLHENTLNSIFSKPSFQSFRFVCLFVCLFGFMAYQTLVGYLTPNPFLCK